MIIVRSPLRITLAGGGLDLPSYYTKYGGFTISAAIDKYVYVSVIRPFVEGIYLKYSQLEHVQQVDEVQHPIIRESLKLLKLKTPQIEITSISDIPATGTGLGSSGSFTTGLLKAIFLHRKQFLQPSILAEMACDININKLSKIQGKQDEYASAFGGITIFNFHKDNSVETHPLNISIDTIHDLEENLLLFFTGYSRSANDILQDQDVKTKNDDEGMCENLHKVRDIALATKKALEDGDIKLFCTLTNDHWTIKRTRTQGMTNEKIDNIYYTGMYNGALCGKIVGAGNGGFMLFYTKNKDNLRKTMRELGLEELRFGFDFEGCKSI